VRGMGRIEMARMVATLAPAGRARISLRTLPRLPSTFFFRKAFKVLLCVTSTARDGARAHGSDDYYDDDETRKAGFGPPCSRASRSWTRDSTALIVTYRDIAPFTLGQFLHHLPNDGSQHAGEPRYCMLTTALIKRCITLVERESD
jgi:hypothetical protein